MEPLLDEQDALKDVAKDFRGEISGEIKSDGFNGKAIERIAAFRRNKKAAGKEYPFINGVVLYTNLTWNPPWDTRQVWIVSGSAHSSWELCAALPPPH